MKFISGVFVSNIKGEVHSFTLICEIKY